MDGVELPENQGNPVEESLLWHLLCDAISDFNSPCRIVACGLFNAGKSSLLNALSGRVGKERFAVGVVPTTSACDHLTDGILQWVDTPGFDVSTTDDAEAYKAICKADILLFLHNLGTPGGLQRPEVDFLNELVQNAETRQVLTERLCIVLTKRDVVRLRNEAELCRRECIIKKQVASEIGSVVQQFTVSSNVYIKGFSESKRKLMEYSRVPALRIRLLEMVQRSRVVAFRKARIANIKAVLQSEIEQEIAYLDQRRQLFEREFLKAEEALSGDFSLFFEQLTDRYAQIDG